MVGFLPQLVEGDDEWLEAGLVRQPNSQLQWGFEGEGEDRCKLGVHPDCCIVFTATNMLLQAASERENGIHQKKLRKKVHGL
jgi:hypothetical protein